MSCVWFAATSLEAAVLPLAAPDVGADADVGAAAEVGMDEEVVDCSLSACVDVCELLFVFGLFAITFI